MSDSPHLSFPWTWRRTPPSERSLRRRLTKRGRAMCVALLTGAATGAFVTEARAEVPVQRTFFRLASSNGHGAVLLDLSQARLTHFREHLFATEEPLLDAGGNELWSGNQPLAVRSRDLLYD